MEGADGSRVLRRLLASAETAGPVDRIEFRDRIAAHGMPAIEAVTPWLADPRLAAFAIRVIERVGRGGEREAAQSTLRGARRRVDPRLRHDLDWALLQLRTPAPDTMTAEPPPARVARTTRPLGVAKDHGASKRPTQAHRADTA